MHCFVLVRADYAGMQLKIVRIKTWDELRIHFKNNKNKTLNLYDLNL